MRLDRLRALEEYHSLLAPFDHHGLLTGAEIVRKEAAEMMDEEELLAELEGAAGSSEINELRHVRANAEKRAAEEIANREKCEEFERFQPLFKQAELEIKSGVRQTRPFGKDASVDAGN